MFSHRRFSLCYRTRRFGGVMRGIWNFWLLVLLGVPVWAYSACPELVLAEREALSLGEKRYGLELELRPRRVMPLVQTADGTIRPLLQGKRPPRWLLESLGFVPPLEEPILNDVLEI